MRNLAWVASSFHPRPRRVLPRTLPGLLPCRGTGPGFHASSPFSAGRPHPTPSLDRTLPPLHLFIQVFWASLCEPFLKSVPPEATPNLALPFPCSLLRIKSELVNEKPAPAKWRRPEKNEKKKGSTEVETEFRLHAASLSRAPEVGGPQIHIQTHTHTHTHARAVAGACCLRDGAGEMRL